MRPEGPFVAERALARHSAALLRRAGRSRRQGADVLAAALGAKLAGLMGKALTPFLAGSVPEVSCGEARIGPCDGPGQRAAAAFGYLCEARRLVVSTGIDEAIVLGLVERCFGGMGQGVTGRMTPAASLLARRIAARLAETLSEALGCGSLEPQAPAEAVSVPGRTAQFELTIAEPGRDPWQIRFAISCDLVEALGEAAASTKPAVPTPAASPSALPWSGIALPLRAVLVDMAVPLGSVAGLEPGQIIPVSVARRVPLKVGGRVVGHGDVGVFDDCAALRLTSLLD